MKSKSDQSSCCQRSSAQCWPLSDLRHTEAEPPRSVHGGLQVVLYWRAGHENSMWCAEALGRNLGRIRAQWIDANQTLADWRCSPKNFLNIQPEAMLCRVDAGSLPSCLPIESVPSVASSNERLPWPWHKSTLKNGGTTSPHGDRHVGVRVPYPLPLVKDENDPGGF